MAVTLLSAVPASPGADAEAEFRRGIQLYESGQYDQAVEVLTPYVDKPADARNAARAMYTIAAIQAAKGRPADAETTLERLLAKYPASGWSLNAYALLAERAAASRDWDRAAERISRFLDLYLAGPYATIDDVVCRQMFERLVECARNASRGASLKVIHRSLRTKYPTSSGTGRVVEFFAGVDPTDPDANLVLNAGFELDAREIGTPVGWTYRGSEPNLQDDIDGTIKTGTHIKLIRARTGTYAAGKFTLWGKHRGWLYQRVPVLPGKRYDVSVYGMTPALEAHPGQVRLGVDIKGGTHPADGSVQWTEPVSPQEQYEKLAFEGQTALTAEGRFLTVYLELRQDNEAAGNAMLFDDVVVQQAK